MAESLRAPKLLAQLRRAVRVRQFSRRTEEAYAAWVRRFVRYHGMRHPAELGAADIEAFLADLAERRGLGSSSQTQALSALLFLYRAVLHQDIGAADIPRARGIGRVPVVLTREEVRALIAGLRGVPRLGRARSGFGGRRGARTGSPCSPGRRCRRWRSTSSAGAGSTSATSPGVVGWRRCRARSGGSRRGRPGSGGGSTCFRQRGGTGWR